jgi:hypothetical protein
VALRTAPIGTSPAKLTTLSSTIVDLCGVERYAADHAPW